MAVSMSHQHGPLFMGILTESLLECFYVAALGSRLAPLLVVGAGMTKTRASAAARTNTVALELAFSANHACQTLRLGDARVIGDGVSGLGGVVARGAERAAIGI